MIIISRIFVVVFFSCKCNQDIVDLTQTQKTLQVTISLSRVAILTLILIYFINNHNQ